MTSLSSLLESSAQPCPQCHHELPITSDYVTWCPQCEWNLRPDRTETPPGSLFERILLTISERNTHHLFTRIQEATAQKPSLTPATVAAYSIAVGIYLITLVLLLSGLTLLVYGRSNFFAFLAGVVLLAMCWIIRPRRTKEAPTLLSRTMAPTLYAQIDAVSQTFGLKPIDGVIVLPEFTAAYEQRGWFRKQYLWLGLPLWATLEPQEQIALLAHELAHGANGDPRRGRFLHTALAFLEHWHNMIRPRTFWGPGEGPIALVAFPFRLIGLGIAWGLSLLIGLFVVLLWRTMQRAEYWADNMASLLSGTDAMVALLEKLHLAEAVSLIIQRATWQRYAKDVTAFVHDIQHAISVLPAHEHERLRRIALRDDTRLDTTHPPTKYRIAYLRHHPHTAMLSAGSREEAARMLQELMAGW
jgi:Zn-dependent protease with chaperone function